MPTACYGQTTPSWRGMCQVWVKNHRKIDLKNHNNVNNKSCNLIEIKCITKLAVNIKLNHRSDILLRFCIRLGKDIGL